MENIIIIICVTLFSITGCPMSVGDLLGSGTISGTTTDSLGSMLELSWKGSRDVPLQVNIYLRPISSLLSITKYFALNFVYF